MAHCSHPCSVCFLIEKEELAFSDEDDRADWEAEQKRLDREWYGLDEGYDDEHNPFSGMSEQYKKRKEEELEKKKKKKMTARQRQINRVNTGLDKHNYSA